MAARRLVLKMSGEALCKDKGFGIDAAVVGSLSREIQAALEAGGLELALVVGGGNFLRGEQIAGNGIDRVTGDNMGMLATIMNAIALQSSLETLGVETRVLSAIQVNDVAEPFIRRRCIRHLEQGRVVILAGGTGSQYFSTDTTAALRALQIGASRLLKATKVSGIYSADPMKDAGAKLHDRLTFLEVLQNRLRVMDATAVSLCMEHKLPIVVFSMKEPGNVERALRGERLGTIVES